MKDRHGCLSVRSKCHMLTANFTKQSAIEVVCVQNNEADLSSMKERLGFLFVRSG